MVFRMASLTGVSRIGEDEEGFYDCMKVSLFGIIIIIIIIMIALQLEHFLG